LFNQAPGSNAPEMPEGCMPLLEELKQELPYRYGLTRVSFERIRCGSAIQ